MPNHSTASSKRSVSLLARGFEVPRMLVLQGGRTMPVQVITRETLVADALEQVPGASALFRRHGVAPETACLDLWRSRRIGDIATECTLRDPEGLVRELNLMLALHATAAP